eukprot:10145209-Karenia_brevis.AAC.1
MGSNRHKCSYLVGESAMQRLAMAIRGTKMLERRVSVSQCPISVRSAACSCVGARMRTIF